MANKSPLYIFDLDGTLALIDHRRHFVERPPCSTCGGEGHVGSADPACLDCGYTGLDQKFKPDWKAFYAACDKDEPNWPVIRTLTMLRSQGCEIRIWSGRSDEVAGKTLDWLDNHIGVDYELQMRKADDFTHDDVLKMRWLGLLPPEDRARLVAVFDDRDKVVAMWRRNGVNCFQVAPGNF
jgi:hypothetical protein